jgi:fido (protein-threonine AMPylation protein)
MTPSREDETDREAFPGFAGFRDDPEAPFYASRMPRFRTSQATATEIVACFSRVVFAVVREASRQPLRMTRADLMRWHRATFRTTFPDQAGKLRDEPTAFQIRWREDGELRKRALQGTEASRVAAEIDAACTSYNAERQARLPEQRSLREAVTGAASLYVELLRIHPFEDGNLRAAFPALQGALISLGAAPVDFENAVAEHDEALGWALRPDAKNRSLEPFVALLLDRMQKAAVEHRGTRLESS